MTQEPPAEHVEQQVFEQIRLLLGPNAPVIDDGTALIGDASVMDSMKLVELCLALEDMAGDASFTFDWTSDEAMSRSRSMFRSAGALAREFQSQKARRR